MRMTQSGETKARRSLPGLGQQICRLPTTSILSDCMYCNKSNLVKACIYVATHMRYRILFCAVQGYFCDRK